MAHPLVDVIDFEIVADYVLEVSFDDDTCQVIDFRSVLHGEVFGPLQDLKVFNRVRLDSEVGNLIWPGGADFDPWTLHEWPQVVDNMAATARSWDAVVEYQA